MLSPQLRTFPRSSSAFPHAPVRRSFSSIALNAAPENDFVPAVADPSELGFRADPSATGAFLFIVACFGFLRFKVSSWEAAQNERIRFEAELQELRVKALDQSVGAEMLAQAEERMEKLLVREEDARSVSLGGLKLRIRVPERPPSAATVRPPVPSGKHARTALAYPPGSPSDVAPHACHRAKY